MDYYQYFNEETCLGQFNKWQEDFFSGRTMEPYFRRRYLPVIEEEKHNKTHTPFLSVITRTQGRRMEMLREVFLCLEAQTNQNFEILLIGHKLDPDQRKQITSLIQEQGPEMREKIRFYEEKNGKRGTPINLGLAHAWGEYGIILDDDDLVCADWAEAFYDIHERGYSRLIWSYALKQDWRVVGKAEQPEAATAAGDLETKYCYGFKDYNFYRCFLYEHMPPSGLAFPLYPFREYGIYVDEELDTQEDSDCFNRLAALCGLIQVKHFTAIYRIWRNMEQSAQVHPGEVWAENFRKACSKVNQFYAPMPWGIIDSGMLNPQVLTSETETLPEGERLHGTLFYKVNMDEAYAKEWLCADSMAKGPEFAMDFVFDRPVEGIVLLRFDPDEKGGVVLEEMMAAVYYGDGTTRNIPIQKMQHNGVRYGLSIVYPERDPQVMWPVSPGKLIERVHVMGRVTEKIPEEALCSGISRIMLRLRNLLCRIKNV